MKAAVLHQVGGIPRYEDFPDPVAGAGEVIIGRSPTPGVRATTSSWTTSGAGPPRS